MPKKDTMVSTLDKQCKGGHLRIPDGWFVNMIDVDADKPYVQICPEQGPATGCERKLDIPPSLAYYMSTHFCGSRKMHGDTVDYGRRQVQRDIRAALGFD